MIAVRQRRTPSPWRSWESGRTPRRSLPTRSARCGARPRCSTRRGGACRRGSRPLRARGRSTCCGRGAGERGRSTAPPRRQTGDSPRRPRRPGPCRIPASGAPGRAGPWSRRPPRRPAPPAGPPPRARRERVRGEAGRAGPRAGRGGGGLPWLAAAAGVARGAAAGLAYQKERGNRHELERAVAVTRDSLAAQQQLVATLLAPDVNTAVLASKGRPPTARLFWNPSRHRVVMAVFDLPPAPSGRTYQLWAIQTGKAPVSLGIFNTAPDGRLTTALDVPPALVAFDVTAVTQEPVGGSPQPTQQQ